MADVTEPPTMCQPQLVPVDTFPTSVASRTFPAAIQGPFSYDRFYEKQRFKGGDYLSWSPEGTPRIPILTLEELEIWASQGQTG